MVEKSLLEIQPPRNPGPRLRGQTARVPPSNVRLEASSLQVTKTTSQQLQSLG